ncbi:MAG: hypothetical protein AVDCRST_MAG54-2182 [uncultured Actinomycetospora sp.]|uniref:Uncharacterized protein n=1 Tax=uncultured Actinomycetospora sp. TaxID=1135996 RepID=A0A6J4IKQ4_9PSEU|nr:MAG: hypothetical protein AVDCRST_MAG54-2182 [uncultured Actinomycetospora sp.]
MVRALERPAHRALVLGADPRAAVAADVEVGVDRAVAPPGDDDALPADLHGLEGAGRRDVRGEDGAEPAGLEHEGLLGREDRRVRVVPARERRAQARRQPRRRGRRCDLSGGHDRAPGVLAPACPRVALDET